MSTSRAESQHSHFGRRRSNTAQSILRPLPPAAPPLKAGDSKVLNLWVHESKDSPTVLFNQSLWPGVADGDLLRIMRSGQEGSLEASILFIVPKEDYCAKPQLQISIPKPIADVFNLKNNGEVVVTKVDKKPCSADYVELVFQDQYLGRNDMWRLGEHLVDQCVYTDQEISFVGTIAAKIQNIYIKGKKVPSAVVTAATRTVYRSLSAKVTIFIQVCHELWEFAGDGERFTEKIVHSFLPALFAKWREAGTSHVVTIVLISRVFYEESEMQGPIREGARQDERGNWYKDFYKVITDHEVIHEWKPTLVSLKNSFWDFQREILLTHHYRAAQDVVEDSDPPVRLVGRLSYAHDGPILESLNLGLNPADTHFIDRSLSLTGVTTFLISPGTGYFRVNKKLLRLTTTRMLDQGFALDLILLTKPPLHQSPIFSFQGTEPEAKTEIEGKSADPLVSDPLWGGDDGNGNHLGAGRLKTFWWEPFWISTTFWDKQMDLPLRVDRFVARAKMHEIQMLGLLEADVLSSIEVPYLPDKLDGSMTATIKNLEEYNEQSSLTQAEADKFDMDIFSLRTNYTALTANQSTTATSHRLNNDRRNRGSASASAKIATIEESPRRIFRELPDETSSNISVPATASGLSTSPSQASIRSVRSTLSKLSAIPAAVPQSKQTLTSKLAPAWLFNPFRSGPSEPQTTQVFASASPIAAPSVTVSTAANVPVPAKTTVPETSAQPVAIKTNTTNKTVLVRTFEEETVVPHRASFARRSPINTPPRDEIIGSRRRSTASTLAQSYISSSPRSWSNPLQPVTSVSHDQEFLARRWEHLLPGSTHKHDIKWKALVTPACLPLTMECLPSNAELESCYDNYYYDFVVDPKDMRSFLVKPPQVSGTVEDVRRAWALAVMRGMAAMRIAQGFQFILRPSGSKSHQKIQASEEKTGLQKNKSFLTNDDYVPKAIGPSDVLRSPLDPVYLSMTNEIHRISYTGDSIQVRRYVRRILPARQTEYECFIWPKLGSEYTSLKTTFTSYALENYGWNRLDMLVAGYEHNFNESLRYWRTRFLVVPTKESPSTTAGPGCERLNDEEIRILGIEKLAEQFTKLRWEHPDEPIVYPAPPVRFLPTTLDPAASVRDESLMDQLDQIHAQGPLRKNMKSEKEIADMPLAAIAKAMREEDGVPIKHYQWHRSHYPDSFIGFDFVSWLAREFSDVSSRAQAAEWGAKLLEQGLFEHCRRQHGFLDGHYYYRLSGEYSIPMTPKGWFRRYTSEETTPKRPGNLPRNRSVSNRKPARKRLILSQTMVTEIDPNKKSDQAEAVVLHHDLIHNPGTCFHFEVQWIGTTARCIEDQLRSWNRTIERYGLKLVEAYVTQISDISSRNPFQSCFPIRLAVPPPQVPDLEARVPEYMQTSRYFEYALLRKFDFIVDVEAAELYPENVDVVYSYRRIPYTHSQFVHRSGVAFIQVVRETKGFLFFTNRLMGPGRLGNTAKNKDYGLGKAADEIRVQLHNFCSDEKALNEFYEEQLALLGNVLEDPPPLSI